MCFTSLARILYGSVSLVAPSASKIVRAKRNYNRFPAYDVNMLLEIDSRRVVYRLDLAELKSAILMRRRHEARSSTSDVFLLISTRFYAICPYQRRL